MFAAWWCGASICLAAEVKGPNFLGPEPCGLCHKDIAAAQSRTAMANTWQGRVAEWLPQTFDASVAEDLSYKVSREGDSLSYSVQLGTGRSFSLPISISMGGRRHGLGFLFYVKEVDGIPLARETLVQARYAWSPEKKALLLAPGCLRTQPFSFESALGLALSPTFESRCLGCHGQPDQSGSGKSGGVHCEACHGAGSGHLAGVARGKPEQGIINPRRMAVDESIGVCARCHVGLTKFADPSASDLLIANQVTALKSSECFIQSRHGLSCTTCHDPHSDTSEADRQAVGACIGCHSKEVSTHAAICPVNATGGCVGCHMPSVDQGPLHLVDHLIRVHPEQIPTQALAHTADLRSRVRPVSEYLRTIATDSYKDAVRARDQLGQGESFYATARLASVDKSASIGGYVGRKELTDLDPGLQEAAANLGYGETSPIEHIGTRWVILQRLPRDFRWSAEQLQNQAEELSEQGRIQAGLGKAQEALMIYPQFLRALSFIGVTFSQVGNPKRGAEVLTLATRMYPTDASAEFELAASLESLGDLSSAADAYKKAIALDGDFTAAYVKLGMILNQTHDLTGAVATFQQGLQVDPLSAELNYDLGMALSQNGETAAGDEARKLARKLDLKLVERREGAR
jgi:tetratricopeptide (TPR) repeat protein